MAPTHGLAQIHAENRRYEDAMRELDGLVVGFCSVLLRNNEQQSAKIHILGGSRPILSLP